MVLALEMLLIQQMFFWGFMSLIAGVIVALFPSNYEIFGMNDDDDEVATEPES